MTAAAQAVAADSIPPVSAQHRLVVAELVGSPERQQFRVRCPQCGEQHLHGAGYGHRVPHCFATAEGASYSIVDQETLQANQREGELRRVEESVRALARRVGYDFKRSPLLPFTGEQTVRLKKGLATYSFTCTPRIDAGGMPVEITFERPAQELRALGLMVPRHEWTWRANSEHDAEPAAPPVSAERYADLFDRVHFASDWWAKYEACSSEQEYRALEAAEPETFAERETERRVARILAGIERDPGGGHDGSDSEIREPAKKETPRTMSATSNLQAQAPQPQAPTLPPAKPINWGELADKEPPERRWAIRGWLGFGHVTLKVGRGGIGKSLLAQQMASALALGTAFIDDVIGPARALYWACEDDHDELWRRQVKIAAWLDAGLDAFTDNLIVVPRLGLENTLASTEYGRLLYSPVLEQLREQVMDLRAEAVFLDNAGQLYGGNENDRHAVTSFLNALVGAMPGRAICLLAHPARSTASEYSGSSAWENAARTRLYLGDKLPDQKPDPDEEPADDVRYLARRKANYSNRDWRRFNYVNGVLVPETIDPQGGVVAEIRERNAERVILSGLARLREMGLHPTDGATSPRYLPRLVVEYKLSEGLAKAELGVAMRRMMVDGRLRRAEVGKSANRSPIHGLEAAPPAGGSDA